MNAIQAENAMMVTIKSHHLENDKASITFNRTKMKLRF